MRISTIMIGTAAAGAALIFAAGPASAGEINGNGQPPGGTGIPTETSSCRSPKTGAQSAYIGNSTPDLNISGDSELLESDSANRATAVAPSPMVALSGSQK